MKFTFLPLMVAGLVSVSTAVLADYEDHPRAGELRKRLVTEFGFTRADIEWVNDALDEADRIDALVEAEQKSAEKVLTWADYRSRHVTQWSIDHGVEFMKRYAAELQRAEDRWQVPKHIIAAIIGIETKYGGYTGKRRVLDALATQGFDHPTRSPFFFNELVEFFVLCKETGMRPEDAQGSYAGAMGIPQFMPSNYRKLGVDFDGDGVVDLWEPRDAIGSTANYLRNYRNHVHKRGWEFGSPVAELAQVQPDSPLTFSSEARTQFIASQFVGAGIRAPSLRNDQTPVGLYDLIGPNGKEIWVAYHNFFAIMSYNPRAKYAMAVYQLSEEIRTRTK